MASQIYIISLILANIQLSLSLQKSKIVQTESRTSSLFECYAEVLPILCKDKKNPIIIGLLHVTIH